MLRLSPGALTVIGAPSLKAVAQLLVLVNATLSSLFVCHAVMVHNGVRRVKNFVARSAVITAGGWTPQ